MVECVWNGEICGREETENSFYDSVEHLRLIIMALIQDAQYVSFKITINSQLALLLFFRDNKKMWLIPEAHSFMTWSSLCAWYEF